jgi:hypothetical protein
MKNREILHNWQGIENKRRQKADIWNTLEEAEITVLRDKLKARRQDNHLEMRSKYNEEGTNKQDLEIINKEFWKKQEQFQMHQYEAETNR